VIPIQGMLWCSSLQGRSSISQVLDPQIADWPSLRWEAADDGECRFGRRPAGHVLN